MKREVRFEENPSVEKTEIMHAHSIGGSQYLRNERIEGSLPDWEEV